jgi:hypothetical protein
MVLAPYWQFPPVHLVPRRAGRGATVRVRQVVMAVM